MTRSSRLHQWATRAVGAVGALWGAMALTCAAAQPADTAPAGADAPQVAVVPLGFAAPLSGPQAHYGEDMRNGLLLALEQANARSLRIGDAVAQFQLIQQDDKADPARAGQVARKLVGSGVRGVLGHFNSGTTLPASVIYHQAGLPQIAMATANAYTDQGFDTAFRMMSSDSQQAEAAVQFIIKVLGAKSVALIDDGSIYGKGLASQVGLAVQAANGRVVAHAEQPKGDADFSGFLGGLQGQSVDVIYFGGPDTLAAALKRQMHERGLRATLVSGDMALSDVFLAQAGEAADGTFASLPGVPLRNMAAGKAFAKAYQERFGQEPGVYAPYAYDGAWNMIDAMRQADSTRPADYLPKLAALRRSGATSDRIAYDAKGNLKELAVTLYEVRGGKWVVARVMVNRADD